MYTLQGKTQPTRHTLFMLSLRMVHDHTYLTWSTYSSLSYHHQQIWTDPLHLRRRAPDTIHNTTTVRSVNRYPASLPQQPRSSGEKSTPVDNWLLGLLGPYHRHAIGTFNTCSRGPTERSLINTGGATIFEVPACHIPTLRPSQPAIPTFP
jgi:hypothetical protein